MTVEQTPMPGDVVIIDRDYCGVERGARAVVDGGEHYGPGLLMVVARASAFNNGHCVSVSGGPCPAVNPADLEYAGTTSQRFWRWDRRGPGAGHGENYDLEVNLWRWV